TTTTTTNNTNNTDSTQVNDRQKLLDAKIIGQAFNSFIILEYGDELLLIDQHAAHERIRYEQIRKQLSEGEAFSQGLLGPITVNLSELEMDKFHETPNILNKLGFDVEDFGDRTVIIRAIPYVLDHGFSGQDFIDILNKLSQEVDTVSEIIPEEIIYMMACKSAVKANREMSKMEIRGLIEDLTSADNPYTCVHGRPIIISMQKREFEKKFKRII
ncbi:MAG: DNA mismatch repair protein MutL, partial [Ruminiclostridium sp.]|nr:DNA mismatch repair protein MutL [Ruminiclostridium sp.]